MMEAGKVDRFYDLRFIFNTFVFEMEKSQVYSSGKTILRVLKSTDLI